MKTVHRLSALAAGLALGLTAPAARGDAIVQSLAPTNLSASTFNQDFQAIAGSPAQMSNVNFAGENQTAGVMESQVFQGTGPEAGLYAYAYQIAVNPGAVTSTSDAAHIDSASFHFNATPVATALAGGGSALSYVITDGQVGGLNLPTQTGPNGTFQVPSELSWQAQSNSGVLRAKFEDAATGTPTLNAGANSATFVVISTQPPAPPSTLVNLQSADPQTNLPSVYAPTTGSTLPIPSPEPSTVLAWAGMAGAVALVHRVRTHRTRLA